MGYKYVRARQRGSAAARQRGIIPILAISTLAACNIVYASYGWAEIPLILLGWIVTGILLKICRSDVKIVWYIILGLCLVYMYMVHMRAIAVLTAGVAVILFMFWQKRIQAVNFAAFSITVAVTFSLSFVIKHYVQSAVWAGAENIVYNDYSSVSYILKHLFTFDGFYKVYTTFLGQLFYIGFASFFIIFAAFYIIGKKFKRAVKKHSVPHIDPVLLFLILGFAAEFVVSVLFLSINISTPGRKEHLVYGRYNDILYSILVAFALTYLVRIPPAIISVPKRVIFAKFSVLYSFLAIIVLYFMSKRENQIFYSAAATNLYIPLGEENNLHYIGVAAFGLIFLLLYNFILFRKRAVKNIALALCTFFSISSAVAYKQITFAQSVSSHRPYERFSQEVSDISDKLEIPVYYYAEGRDYYICLMQFCFDKKTLHVTGNANVSTNKFLLVCHDTYFNTVETQLTENNIASEKLAEVDTTKTAAYLCEIKK